MKKKRIDFLTTSFIIFFSFIFLCLIAGFYLFNVLKLKDLNLNDTVFASTQVSFDELGFSDMTLNEFLDIFQNISSPDEQKIMSNSPKKIDKTKLFYDLSLSDLNADNLQSSLFDGNYNGLDTDIIITEREFCLLTDILIKDCGYDEYENITEICGNEAVSIKNIKLYNKDNNHYADVVVSVNIENIRNKILQNFGYPIFQICGKLYFINTYLISDNNGVVSGEVVSSSIYNMDKEMTDKVLNALFVSYYLVPDISLKDVIAYENLSVEVLDIIITALNKMGSVALKNYSTQNQIYRNDIRGNEMVFYIT